MYLFQFSTCFGQPCAYHQENQLYQYDIPCMSPCVHDRLVCKLDGTPFHPNLHARRSSTQNDIYGMSYWYNWFSCGCPKHVENWNKYTWKGIVRRVGYLQRFFFKLEVWSALKPICKLYGTAESRSPARNRNNATRTSSFYPSHYNDWAIQTLCKTSSTKTFPLHIPLIQH